MLSNSLGLESLACRPDPRRLHRSAQLVLPWLLAVACGNEPPMLADSTTDDGGTTTGSPEPVCGDGVPEDGEDCDDGNLDAGDGCNPRCAVEGPPAERIFVGGYCTCAVWEDGSARCWGGFSHDEDDPTTVGVKYSKSCSNSGEYGGLEIAANLMTFPVPQISQVAPVFSTYGPYAGCAATSDGRVGCWYAVQPQPWGVPNVDPADFMYYTPTFDWDLPLQSSEIAMLDLGGPAIDLCAASTHACAVMEWGGVRCWGFNYYGQLGYGHTDPIWFDDEHLSPVEAGDVPLDGDVVHVSCGTNRTCVILDDGRVRCWGNDADPDYEFEGSGVWAGHLGLGPSFSDTALGDDEPVLAGPAVELPGPATDVVVWEHHVTSLLADGRVYTWGDPVANYHLGHPEINGAIGDDETPLEAGPVDVGGVAVGITPLCALLEGGLVRCWGNDILLAHPELAGTYDWGEDTAGSLPPVVLSGKAVQLAQGYGGACALLEDGNINCWGWNEHGTLGYGHLDNIGDDETPAQAGVVPYR